MKSSPLIAFFAGATLLNCGASQSSGPKDVAVEAPSRKPLRLSSCRTQKKVLNVGELMMKLTGLYIYRMSILCAGVFAGLFSQQATASWIGDKARDVGRAVESVVHELSTTTTDAAGTIVTVGKNAAGAATTVTKWANGVSVSEVKEASGKITTVTDFANGNIEVVTKEVGGKVSTATSWANGVSSDLATETSGAFNKMTHMPDSSFVNEIRDAAGNMTRIGKDAAGATFTEVTPVTGYITGDWRDPLGNTRTWKEKLDGTILSLHTDNINGIFDHLDVTDFGKIKESFSGTFKYKETFDSADHLLTAVATDTKRGIVTATTYGSGITNTVTTDLTGKLISSVAATAKDSAGAWTLVKTDAAGLVKTLAIDARGATITSFTDAKGTALAVSTDARGKWVGATSKCTNGAIMQSYHDAAGGLVNEWKNADGSVYRSVKGLDGIITGVGSSSIRTWTTLKNVAGEVTTVGKNIADGSVNTLVKAADGKWLRDSSTYLNGNVVDRFHAADGSIAYNWKYANGSISSVVVAIDGTSVETWKRFDGISGTTLRNAAGVATSTWKDADGGINSTVIDPSGKWLSDTTTTAEGAVASRIHEASGSVTEHWKFSNGGASTVVKNIDGTVTDIGNNSKSSWTWLTNAAGQSAIFEKYADGGIRRAIRNGLQDAVNQWNEVSGVVVTEFSRAGKIILSTKEDIDSTVDTLINIADSCIRITTLKSGKVITEVLEKGGDYVASLSIESKVSNHQFSPLDAHVFEHLKSGFLKKAFKGMENRYLGWQHTIIPKVNAVFDGDDHGHLSPEEIVKQVQASLDAQKMCFTRAEQRAVTYKGEMAKLDISTWSANESEITLSHLANARQVLQAQGSALIEGIAEISANSSCHDVNMNASLEDLLTDVDEWLVWTDNMRLQIITADHT